MSSNFLKIPTILAKIMFFFLTAFTFSLIFVHSLIIKKIGFSALTTSFRLKAWLAFFFLTFFIFFLILLTDRRNPFNKFEKIIFGVLPFFYGLVIFLPPASLSADSYLYKTLAAGFITICSLLAGVICSHSNLSIPKLEKFSDFLFISVFILFIVVFCIVRFKLAINSDNAYDMCLYYQAIFNTLKGKFLLMTTAAPAGPNLSYMAIHFVPILALVAPLYLIFPTAFVFPITLVVLCWVTAFPLRALAKNVLKNTVLANLIAISYLAFVPVSSVMLWKFRVITFAIPTTILAFYFLERNKKIWFLIFSVLAVMAKEEMLIVFALVGLFLIIFKKERLLGAALILICLPTFFIYAKFLVPFLWKGQKYFWISNYFSDFFSITTILKRVFSLRSLQYLLFMLSPVIFMPFFSQGYLILVLPALFITFLSTQSTQANIYFHYSGSFIPLIFISCVYGFLKFKPFSEKFLKFATGWILVNALITNLFFSHHFLRVRDFLNFDFQPQRLTIFEVKKLVPPDTSILVSDEIGPWFSFREKYYTWFNDGFKYHINVDYIFVYVQSKHSASLKELVREGIWRVIFYKNNLLLLKRDRLGPNFNLKFFQKIRPK